MEHARFADLPASPVPAYQSDLEFGALWEFVAHREHANVVEIGSLYGGTLWHWLHLPHVATVTSVDVVTDGELREEVLAARAEWQAWSPRLRIVEGDSHDAATVDDVVSAMDAIDVLFIDGDHTYVGVVADWEAWSPHVRAGGIVAFHDTVPNGSRNEPGVVQFVNELKRAWRILSVEFFDMEGAGITAFVV